MAELIGIDGLDGTGKTTLAKMLAAGTNSTYMYFTADNLIAPLRSEADALSPQERFAYYLSINLLNVPRLERLKQESTSAIILDRTPLSTFAYHDAMGLNTEAYQRLHDILIGQFDAICYVQASPDTRLARIQSRLGEGKMHKFDQFSLELSERIHTAYLRMIPQNAVIVDTSDLNIQEMVAAGTHKLMLNGHFSNA